MLCPGADGGHIQDMEDLQPPRSDGHQAPKRAAPGFNWNKQWYPLVGREAQSGTIWCSMFIPFWPCFWPRLARLLATTSPQLCGCCQVPEWYLDRRRPFAITVLGHRLVVWWDASSTAWRCFQDSCPHRLAPLSGEEAGCGHGRKCLGVSCSA
jgi:hypothetical protein